MKKPQPIFVISFSIVAILTFASFASCMAAEFKKTKKTELKLKGIFCLLPESEAFELGVAGLVCLIMAQIIGNGVICHGCWAKENRKSCSVTSPLLLATLFISWVSFGIAMVLMSGGSSMSRRQDYNKGWMEGECYVVKDGIFIAAALLVLLNGASTIGSFSIIKTHLT